MTENLIVGALVVASLVYVVVRARRTSKSGGCGCDCGGDCGRGRRAEKKGDGCACGGKCRGCGEKPESTCRGRSR